MEVYMKNVILKSFMLGSALLMAGCVSSPIITGQSLPGVDMSAYKTYGWISPLATDNAGYSTIVTSHLKRAVQNEMSVRGYVYDAVDPDLQINFFTNVENRTEVYSTPAMGLGYYGYRGGYGYGFGMPMYGDVETRNYKVGTLNIDVVDARRKALVWEGMLEGTLSRKSMEDPAGAINSAVRQIYATFPVPAPAPVPAQ
jgi:hypothetical protein